MFDLTGKKALVTGASGGIGGDIARGLHAQGATVALSGTREAPLKALADELGDCHYRFGTGQIAIQDRGCRRCDLGCREWVWPVQQHGCAVLAHGFTQRCHTRFCRLA